MIWTFRAIFYPAAALVAVLLLTRGDDPPPGPVTLYGRTAQGLAFNASVRDGRVYRIGTFVRAQCPGDRTWRSTWWPIDGRRARFVSDGDRVRLRTLGGVVGDWSVTQVLTLDARVSGGRMSGTVASVVSVTAPFEATCRSGPVSFSAAG